MDSAHGLVLDRVSKSYPGAVRAVSQLSLEVAPGEVLVLTGPSGCGKTTTLRLIAGLEVPSAGEICIGGNNVTRLPPQRRGIAMVFQDYVLFPHLSVNDNLRFGLAAGSRSDESWFQQVCAALEIEELVDRMPGAISGGQRQRIALARAIVRKRPVTLMDEPLSNVDQQLRWRIRRRMKDLVAQTEISLVYVTHDQSEAFAFADRMAILDGGALQQVAPPAEVYTRPANQRVASIISQGPISFVTGDVTRAGGRFVIQVAGQELTLEGRWPDAFLARPMVFGIRPEAVILGDSEASGTPARVTAIESQGDSILAHLAIVGGEPPAAAQPVELIARCDARRPLRPGQAVWLAVDANRVLCFAADTGRRLEIEQL